MKTIATRDGEKLLQADVPSPLTGRIYPRRILEGCTEVPSVFGQIGMPKDIDAALHVDPHRISHRVTDLRMEGDQLVGKVEILDTGEGKLLQSMMENDLVEFRMCGLGTYTVIGDYVDTYKLVSINAVAKPKLEEGN